MIRSSVIGLLTRRDAKAIAHETRPRKVRVRPQPIRTVPDMIEIFIEIEGLTLVNELNVREFWRTRQARAKKQRELIYLRILVEGGIPPLPAVVTFTRLYEGRQRRMDHDGFIASCKHLRDGVADAYGVDDRDATGLKWAYVQEKGPALVGVMIQRDHIAAAPAPALFRGKQ